MHVCTYKHYMMKDIFSTKDYVYHCSSGRTWLGEVAGDDPVTAPETPTHPDQSQTHAVVGKLVLAGGEDVIDVVRSRGVSRPDLF